MEKGFHIGCSGYYYSFWKGRFYPSDVPPSHWLEYYSRIFDTVELNGTFYRMPRISTLQNYARQTPEDFTFAVKMSKYITHILRLKDAKQSVRDFQHIVLEGLESKLACFLFQLPPSFQYSTENLDRVMECVPHNESSVVEFRHPSWWNETTVNLFRNHSITFCNVDFPRFTAPAMNTPPRYYLRLHGNPDLFKSSYSRSDLESYADSFPGNCTDYRIYFNNTYYEAGYTNAASLMEIVSGRADAANIV